MPGVCMKFVVLPLYAWSSNDAFVGVLNDVFDALNDACELNASGLKPKLLYESNDEPQAVRKNFCVVVLF